MEVLDRVSCHWEGFIEGEEQWQALAVPWRNEHLDRVNGDLPEALLRNRRNSCPWHVRYSHMCEGMQTMTGKWTQIQTPYFQAKSVCRYQREHFCTEWPRRLPVIAQPCISSSSSQNTSFVVDFVNWKCMLFMHVPVQTHSLYLLSPILLIIQRLLNRF